MRSSVTRTEKIRALDAFEEIFWLLEQSVPRSAVLLAELEGVTAVPAWEEAVRALERRYPALSIRITKAPGDRPFFAYAAGQQVPFRVVPLPERIELEEEMGRAIEASFGDGSGPLMRVTLFHGATRCAVLLVSHHGAFDGKTNLMVLLDLLAAVAGEELGPPRPMPTALSALFGLPPSGPYTKTLASTPPPAPEEAAAPERRVRIKRLELSRDETAALVRGARAAATTVQGALVAALAIAGRSYRDTWRSAPIRYAIPFDVRGMLSIADTPGLLVSAHVATLASSPHRSFWELARIVSDDLAKIRTRESVRAGLLVLRRAVEVEHDGATFWARQRNSPMMHELMVTNYGNTNVRTTFGPLTLSALSSGSASGGAETQKISAITVDGRMMMTHVSPDPFPALLDDARAILVRETAGR